MSGDLLGNLLRQVSRSFYLSLAILPNALREPIGLAYLLARAADTITDTEPVARKLTSSLTGESKLERLQLDEKSFRWLLDENAMATEKKIIGA